jgi:hypothetical protein
MNEIDNIEVVGRPVLPISTFQDSKQARVYVHSEDRIHMSWDIGQTDNEMILSFEFIPENYPSGSYCFWSSPREYQDAISEVPWIQSNMDDDHPDKNHDFDQEEETEF